MIFTETIHVAGRKLIRTASDSGFMIQNENGGLFEEAVDVPDAGHVYTETDIPIPNEEVDAETALAELLEVINGE